VLYWKIEISGFAWHVLERIHSDIERIHQILIKAGEHIDAIIHALIAAVEARNPEADKLLKNLL
jgi:hypothetical protein